MAIVAVTGTNGKTSVCEALHVLIEKCGRPVVSYTSLGVRFGPGPRCGLGPEWTLRAEWIGERLQRWHDAAGEDGVLIVEVTSHWIEIGALDGLALDVTILTSLGADHIEAHGGLEAYHALKKRLLASTRDGGTVVAPHTLAGDAADALDPSSAAVLRLVGEGYDVSTRLVAEPGATRTPQAVVTFCDREVPLSVAPEASHFLQNLCLAVGAALALDAHPDELAAGLPAVRPPPGRHHLMRGDCGRRVIVDSAHNPEALRACLSDARRAGHGRVLVVFGCGGDRDRWKRAEMGRVAGDHADVVIVTDDNPRREDPESIRLDILEGAPEALEIAPREAAIPAGLGLCGTDDLLVVAGMGPDSWKRADGSETDDITEVGRTLGSEHDSENKNQTYYDSTQVTEKPCAR